MRTLNASARGFEKRLLSFIETVNDLSDVAGPVSDVLSAIKDRGDAALIEFTERFDGVTHTPKTLRVPEKALKNALSLLGRDQKRAFKAAIASVAEFHKQTLPKSWKSKNGHGATVGERFYPINRVGLYVPGGQVPLVSTVIMTSVLAKIAGVPSIAVATPPSAANGGLPSSTMLAALNLCGIEEVYALGGAQAIGAFGYGTQSIPAVDKVFGPGNAFVNEAKRQLFGRVGIDLQPGPSEVMIIADETANPVFVAADLLAQAEHGTGKEKVFLAVPSQEFLDQVQQSIQDQLPTCNHADAIAKVLKIGALGIITPTLEHAVKAANMVAPEHLELQVQAKLIESLTKKITTAGAILQGHWTPTVLGDFTAGPSHTLPTGRTSRFFSGLQVTDFMRRSSIVKYSRSQLEKAQETVSLFSELEQLDAHGNSLNIRLGN
ncbi:MAG: histidinol dehydrogenase [Verrucomicrobiota bacterium]